MSAFGIPFVRFRAPRRIRIPIGGRFKRIMKLKFQGLPCEWEAAAAELTRDRFFVQAEDGFPVQVSPCASGIRVAGHRHYATLECERTSLFPRALGLLLERLAGSLPGSRPFAYAELSPFQSVGAMFDVSRNAVLRVSSVKRLLKTMAWMGFDRLLLYMEDTFEIPEQPYFGYMRGRYSFDELKEIDDYAFLFGIEVVPAIQTLGHMRQFLKWGTDPELADTGDILRVDQPETYMLIEQMMRAVTAPLRSRTIHLGMDEAEQVGLGAYLRKHGFRNRFDLMSGHVTRVANLAASLGLQPMMWSDMYFKFASGSGQYYDHAADLPDSVRGGIPEKMKLVYWDYYSEDKQHYRTMLRNHVNLGGGTVFAGGIWTFVGVNINFDKTFATSRAALSACREEGVREVFATLWGDDGAETNYFAALPGLQFYAEHVYAEQVSEEDLRRRFKSCTGLHWDDYMKLSKIDGIPKLERAPEAPANPSKILLWQDLLLGMFDSGAERALARHYSDIKGQWDGAIAEAVDPFLLYTVAKRLCEVLELKAELGRELLALYGSDNREALAALADERLPRLQEAVERLRLAHSEQWHLAYKPFGWEVLDARYGGLMARIRTAADRVRGYVQGSILSLEELEQPRLKFDPGQSDEAQPFGCFNSYSRIFSACL